MFGNLIAWASAAMAVALVMVLIAARCPGWARVAFKRCTAAFLALLFSIAWLAPSYALTVTDTTRTWPTRTCSPGQVVCYFRVTINWNDSRISSGVWFGTIPKNAYIYAIDAYVSTAFNAGTTNVVTIGATTTANEIVASGITAGSTGTYHLTSAAGLGTVITSNSTYQTVLNGDVPLYAKYAQTGTAATAGAVTIVILFIKNDDQ
jgi:hypothetical protein